MDHWFMGDGYPRGYRPPVWKQPSASPAEALAAFQEGLRARPGQSNPYAGRRGLGSAWVAGHRQAIREAWRYWQDREQQRNQRRTEDGGDT
ncbi:hypothetical protein GCM10009624_34260 [Gordonia sinesedis]